MKKNSVIVPDDSNLIHIAVRSPVIGPDQWNAPATNQRKKRERQQQRTEDLRQRNQEEREYEEYKARVAEWRKRTEGFYSIINNFGMNKSPWQISKIDDGGVAAIFLNIYSSFSCEDCGMEFNMSSAESDQFKDENGEYPCPVCSGRVIKKDGLSGDAIDQADGESVINEFVSAVKSTYPNVEVSIQETREPHGIYVEMQDQSWVV